MAKTIKPFELGDAIQKELTTYHKGVIERVNEAGAQAIKKLQSLTKSTAPVASGSFKRHIATAEETDPATGMKSFVWYVKKPDHRITHLVVHGHVTNTGRRTKGNPFLHHALSTVLPEYEKNIEEAVKE